MTMTDWKDRFRKEFVREDDGLLAIGKHDEQELLAFIGEVADEYYSKGASYERQRITSMIEGMRKPVCGCDTDPDEQAPGYHSKDCDLMPYGYNQALDDILLLVRGDLDLNNDEHVAGAMKVAAKEANAAQRETMGIREETECLCRSGCAVLGPTKWCCREGCPVHKPRTEHPKSVIVIEGKDLKVHYAPRTEETDYVGDLCCSSCKCKCEETEKEGASFSGRGEDIVAARNYLEEALDWADQGQRGDPNGAKSYQAHKLIKYALDRLPRPKENTTPQSREQGGEKRCTGCNGPFLQHHHQHKTRKGAFHSSCYKKTK